MNRIISLKIPCFNLDNTFNNGQCFRWNKGQDGWYEGVAYNRVIRIKQENDTFYFYNTTEEEINTIWYNYFDLGRDYAKLQHELMLDQYMRTAIKYSNGMHILQQDPWETLISFIISQNNNIKRIKGIIEKICVRYGRPIQQDGKTFYTFPTASELMAATEDDLMACGAGYRAAYICKTTEKIIKENIDLNAVKEMPYQKAKDYLMQFCGVGPKVADCVLLFGYGFYHAFPVDTWVKKTMQTLYLDSGASNEKIMSYAENYFGSFAGIAQQYLFFAAREKQLLI